MHDVLRAAGGRPKAPFEPGAVSLPADVGDVPLVTKILPDRAQEYLEGFEEQMFVAVDERTMSGLRVHSDQRLRSNQRRYGGFVQELHRLGMVHYSTMPLCEVGGVFVWKKGREMMRSILGCRRTDGASVAAPGVSLLTGEGLSRIEVEVGPGGECVEELVFGGADLADCLHRMRIESPLGRWFCFPVGTAKNFRLTGRIVEGRRLRSDVAYPCAGTLPMGWSWSLYSAQSAKPYRLGRAIGGGERVTDRGGPCALRGGEARVVHRYVYVDNLGFLSHDAVSVAGAQKAAVRRFEAAGGLPRG